MSNPANHPNSISLWRTARGYSIEKLEGLSGISRATISRYENGRTGYSQPTLEALARALNCDVPELLAKGLTTEDVAIRDRLRHMTAEQKRRVLRLIQALTDTEAG